MFTLENVSPETYIGFGTFFSKRSAKIGKRVSIGAYCILGDVELEGHILIGSRVSITSGKSQHLDKFQHKNLDLPANFERLRVGSHTWIGEGAIIMANVGCGCIIGGGAVVVGEIPSHHVAAGNPAKVVSQIGRL
jgi:acetyltransferase-like isoleucine patch superfamily enzyme